MIPARDIPQWRGKEMEGASAPSMPLMPVRRPLARVHGWSYCWSEEERMDLWSCRLRCAGRSRALGC